MDGLLYYAALGVLGIFIFTMMQHNNSMMAMIALVIGIYIVYSHETGYTATDFRHEMVDAIDDSAIDYSRETDVESVKKSLE